MKFTVGDFCCGIVGCFVGSFIAETFRTVPSASNALAGGVIGAIILVIFFVVCNIFAANK